LLPYAQAASLVIVVAILYVRPQGLFGQRVEANW
jgi:branched-subunit amino acid ABC-type transport system permease component